MKNSSPSIAGSSGESGGRPRLKVLISAFACHPPTSGEGGEEKVLGAGESILGWNLIDQISRTHEVWVITQRRNRKGIERARSGGALPGVRFEYLDWKRWPKKLWVREITLHLYYYFWQIAALFRARRLHRATGFDLAHHITFANYWMPSFIGSFLPVPFVWGPVGGGQRTPKPFLSRYPVRGKISDRLRGVSQFIGRRLLISRKIGLKRAGAILVCNRETMAMFPAKHRQKIAFFPVTGISRSDLRKDPDRDLKRDHSFSVLTTGRLVHWKYFDGALRAFSRFAAGNPDSRFLLIGDGPEAPHLRTLVEELSPAGAVDLIPWLPREDLLRKMREADAFLYLSLREGGGAVVIEAMAAGLPVVCLDIAGPGFHIREDWGIKIAPRSPEGVIQETADALEALASDSEYRRRLGDAARRRAEEFYTWERLGERMLDIYGSVLDQRPVPGGGGAEPDAGPADGSPPDSEQGSTGAGKNPR